MHTARILQRFPVRSPVIKGWDGHGPEHGPRSIQCMSRDKERPDKDDDKDGDIRAFTLGGPFLDDEDVIGGRGGRCAVRDDESTKFRSVSVVGRSSVFGAMFTVTIQ